MKSEIISVGTELLLGDVINTNAAYLSLQLQDLGIDCFYHTVVGDNQTRIHETLKLALTRSNLIIITGGLGPTYDDITRESVAEVLELPLEFDQNACNRITEIFRLSNRVMTDNNRRQAYKPKGSTFLPNDRGTAPGILIEVGEKKLVLLPGPPEELKQMFEMSLIPILKGYQEEVLVSKHVNLFGIGESQVEAILRDEMVQYTNPTLAPYANLDTMYLRISAKARNKEQAEALIEPVLKDVLNRFKPYVYGVDVLSMEAALVETLQKRELKIATSESCTGGLLSERITRINGSSNVFELGVVSYSDEIKNSVLGVSQALLDTHTSYSLEVVESMCRGLMKLVNADIYVAISGIAGPNGGSITQPIGTVYVCVIYRGEVVTQVLNLGRKYRNDRDRIRLLASTHAMKMVLDLIDR